MARNLALKKYEYLSAEKRNAEAVRSLEELGDCVSGGPGMDAELEGRRTAEPESGGMLCYVWLWRDCWWTADEVAEGDGEWNFAGNRYIMTTEEGTYFLYYASDVQFPPEKEAEYRRMEQGISQLRFLPHLN